MVGYNEHLDDQIKLAEGEVAGHRYVIRTKHFSNWFPDILGHVKEQVLQWAAANVESEGRHPGLRWCVQVERDAEEAGERGEVGTRRPLPNGRPTPSRGAGVAAVDTDRPGPG